MAISRRDFLNGVALTIAASMTPLSMLRANPAAEYLYPPLRTGMRGNHPGSFEAAHKLAREGHRFALGGLAVKETYDLVVVGAGISGLAAAWYYRQRHPDASILILDNHDDFGGHAKRNEFHVGDNTLLTYGGSESFQSPEALFSEQVNSLLESLNVDIEKFKRYFDQDYYYRQGMSRGVFFDKAHFGVDKVVGGSPEMGVADDLRPDLLNARSLEEYIRDFPLPESDIQALLTLHINPPHYLQEMSVDDKVEYLSTISYLDFLKNIAGLSDSALLYFRSTSTEFYGYGIDSIAAIDAHEVGYPGFTAMGLPEPGEEVEAELNEPYIYHFPDGNASVARLLVRDLIPETASGNTMEDVVMAKFDYHKLDLASSKTRLRLNSTVVRLDNPDGPVDIGYLQDGVLHRVQGRQCILACYNMMIPSMVPSLPAAQKEALHQNVKAPLVYSKVVLKNWHAFKKVGVHSLYSPTAPYSLVKLDYPVNMGGYQHAKGPEEPIVVHMVQVPTAANTGLDVRQQLRMGRAELLGRSFAEMEQEIRAQLSAILNLSPGDLDGLIEAITINRWSHGYSYEETSLFDTEESTERTIHQARQRHGQISIANSDAAWSPYMHAAIDEAWRAVNELTGQEI
ncbi:NAD(P)/FAD-dependent oxidoreductase [Marinobacter sp. S0848L]|uniref:NAD(P)-binding protein n=1 Tax=Marinobacter sp. S0848L TaxID=2926423 RepID=UPI001FF49053|nr:NAD(P)/FAD-dependent oxidoreductase [Marinobacter sp. S0848L]MCK0104895.1 NAD(P)/FAD-dependent oxidoreductase [Marinobacter sp. S0848L]